MLQKIGKLTFAKPDEDTFVLLAKAKQALRDGGAMPAILNGANEIAVDAFLNQRISFCDIFDIVCRVYDDMNYATRINDLEGILECDKNARRLALSMIKE